MSAARHQLRSGPNALNAGAIHNPSSFIETKRESALRAGGAAAVHGKQKRRPHAEHLCCPAIGAARSCGGEAALGVSRARKARARVAGAAVGSVAFSEYRTS